jgi:DNA polymerase/3'-5' exonuclease PolX
MKIRRAHAEVAPVAVGLVQFFTRQGLVCDVGGSFRRRADQVGDLDIVVQADSLSDVILPGWLFFDRLGEQAAHGVFDLGGQPFGVDIWCATERQWGAFLWYITGSKELNILMRQKAKAQGLKLSQFGLFDGAVQVDDGTEIGVASALGMDWVEPADRQRFVRSVVVPDQVFEVASSSRDISYVVSRVDSVWSCSCPHHTYRKVECKHIKQVRAHKAVAA